MPKVLVVDSPQVSGEPMVDIDGSAGPLPPATRGVFVGTPIRGFTSGSHGAGPRIIAQAVMLPVGTILNVIYHQPGNYAGGLARFAVYSSTSTGYPGSLLAETIEISTATGAPQTHRLSLWLPIAVYDLYWLSVYYNTGFPCYCGDVTLPSTQYYILDPANVLRTAVTVVVAQTTYGSFPAQFPTTLPEFNAATPVYMALEYAP